MRGWLTWHSKKVSKGYPQGGIRSDQGQKCRASCLTEFSAVWAYNPKLQHFPLAGPGRQTFPTPPAKPRGTAITFGVATGRMDIGDTRCRSSSRGGDGAGW